MLKTILELDCSTKLCIERNDRNLTSFFDGKKIIDCVVLLNLMCRMRQTIIQSEIQQCESDK